MAVESRALKERGNSPWLKRISRISAWALLLLVIALVISGWGITQTGIIYKITFGLIDRGTANFLHRTINMPLAFFFLLHVLINIRRSVSGPGRATGWLVNSALIIAGLALMGIVVYMEYFRLGG